MPDDKSKGHDRFRLGYSNYLPDLDYRLSKVVRAGNFLFLQGQTGLALDGSGLVGRGDPAVQADEAMKNVKTLLEESGSRMEDICKVTVYVTDMVGRAVIYPVLGRHLRGVNPVSTGIVLEALANPELDFEIDVFAAIG
ncbi:MAG: RidA family protein [SAR202 cluster bacterium]|nr:RidA family protein [SAR202 cluster bacterium]